MKAIVNFENRYIAVWSHEVTNDDHAILAEHGFAGWEVQALFRSELNPPATEDPLDPPYKITSTGDPVIPTPGSTFDIDNDFMDEAIKFGYQRIDPNKHNTHDFRWRYSIKS